MLGLAYSAPQADPNAPAKPATATISGRVVDILGASVAKARVSAELVPTSRSFTCGTSADGKFTLPGLDAGSYRIVVERSGYLRKVFESRTTGGDGTLITLTPGQERTDVVVHMIPEATITGRILDEDTIRLQMWRYDFLPTFTDWVCGGRSRLASSRPTPLALSASPVSDLDGITSSLLRDKHSWNRRPYRRARKSSTATQRLTTEAPRKPRVRNRSKCLPDKAPRLEI
jgi:hypothetical protein